MRAGPDISAPAGASVLAIDLGATSGRAILGTIADGRVATREVYRFATPLVERDGHLFWDLGAIWGHVQTGIAAALAIAPGLTSVSVDTWAVDYVPLGADGQPLRDPYAYRDGRTEGWAERALAIVPPKALFARTGLQVLRFNTLFQVLADADGEPGVVAATAQRLLIAEALLFRLSGRAVAERTMASTTHLLDAATGEWDTELMKAFDLDPAQWPPVVAPGTVLGPLLKSALPDGVVGDEAPQVIAGCSHDTAAAVAAVPAEGASWAYLSSGTWSLLGAELDAPVLIEAARLAGFTNEAGLDGTTRFLKNRTGMWVLEECLRVWSDSGDTPGIEALIADAEAAPPLGGTLDLDAPAFGRRTDMPALLRASCREAGLPEPATRGELVRLIFESLAASAARTLRELEALTGVPVETLHIVGGGSRNAFLNQLTADACGCRVVAGPAEATALGNLLVQARTLGLLSGTIRETVRRSTTLLTFDPTHPHV